MSQSTKRYTHSEKGGEYDVVGTSAGAGQRKGDVVIVYRNAETGQILHREPEDFAMRMKPAAPSINAQLLAALEAVVNGDRLAITKAQAALDAAKGAV